MISSPHQTLLLGFTIFLLLLLLLSFQKKHSFFLGVMEERGSKNLRRNRPGQKLDEFFLWEAEDLDSIDTIFKVQQYLQRLIGLHSFSYHVS
jgi:hypothetical protein